MDDTIFDNLFFQGLSKEAAKDLDIQVEECRFRKDELIFDEGEEGDHLFLVWEGNIQISKKGRAGKQEILSVQWPGDFFGEMSFLDGCHRSARATAVSDVVLGRINGEEIERYLSHSPETIRRFARRVSAKLRSANSVFIEKLIETERLSLLGTMMTGIVHDIRNPIATLGMLSHYLKSRDDPVLADLGKVAENSVDQMKFMIQELLDFAKGESNLDLKPVTVTEIVESLDILQRVEGSGVTVLKEIEYEGPITVDRHRFQRLLENVVKNAWESLGSEGRLNIRIFQEGDVVEFQIEDTGSGIAPEILTKVFEPFMTHGKRNGTGIGLAIAKSVIEAHQGTIRMESVVDKGTTCFISLPLSDQAEG